MSSELSIGIGPAAASDAMKGVTYSGALDACIECRGCKDGLGDVVDGRLWPRSGVDMSILPLLSFKGGEVRPLSDVFEGGRGRGGSGRLKGPSKLVREVRTPVCPRSSLTRLVELPEEESRSRNLPPTDRCNLCIFRARLCSNPLADVEVDESVHRGEGRSDTVPPSISACLSAATSSSSVV